MNREYITTTAASLSNSARNDSVATNCYAHTFCSNIKVV